MSMHKADWMQALLGIFTRRQQARQDGATAAEANSAAAIQAAADALAKPEPVKPKLTKVKK